MNSDSLNAVSGGVAGSIAKDSLLAVALLVSLGAVYGLDRGAPKTDSDASTPKPKVVVHEVETQEESQPQSAPLRLAVTPPSFDDVGKLLDTLGSGFRYTKIDYDELLDEKRLADFDVVFITCSGVPNSWVDKVLADADRPGVVNVQVKPEILERLGRNLKQFVERGGTLYASDFQFALVRLAFPEFIDNSKVQAGKAQTVTAESIDPSLTTLVGSQIPLKFDMNGWFPAAMTGQSVRVLLKGKYEPMEGESHKAPLLVKFPVKDGNVVFTSFHNEKQNSELEIKLLRYLVFTTVLAKTEAKVTQTLVEGGFSPAGRSLLSASAAAPSVTQTHKCDKPGPLRFALGFENRGAHLKLTIEGPGGVRHEKEGTSSFTIDIANAVAGDWKYTVTALKTPYENFPFALTIGQK